MAEEDIKERSRAEAGHPATSAQRLETLSTDASLRSIVGRNPSAPASLLEILAQDQDAQVRQAVAGNPNTPWQTLEHLAWEFPREFLSNPIGPLQMLVHPEQISTEEAFGEALLREASIPPLWWNWVRDHSVLGTSQAVHLHIQFSGEIPSFWHALLGEEHMLLPLVELLALDNSQEASFLASPSSEQLKTTPESDIEQSLQWLAHHPDEKIRKQVARYSQTQAEILRILAQDQDAWVRQAVAENKRTPVEVLARLGHDAKHYVRRAVAEKWQTPGEILHVLAQDQDPLVRRAVAENKQTPVEALHILSQDQDAWVRVAVAENGQTPAKILAALAQDQDIFIRKAVASHPQTSIEVLRTLAQDKDKSVRSAVAENEQTPAEILATLMKKQPLFVKMSVASNPQTPVKLLQILAQHTDPNIRRMVAENPQTPAELLAVLALNTDISVLATVGANERTPAEALRTLAGSKFEWVRQAVAGNAQTPEEARQILVRDKNKDIRWIATFVQRWLFVESGTLFPHRELWKNLFETYHASRPKIKDAPIKQQMDQVAELNVSEQVRGIILAILTIDWDAPMICSAFSERAVSPEKYRPVTAPFVPPVVLHKLAASSSWEVRFLVALHDRTSKETRRRLSQDGNRYVRAVARAKTAQTRETVLPE